MQFTYSVKIFETQFTYSFINNIFSKRNSPNPQKSRSKTIHKTVKLIVLITTTILKTKVCLFFQVQMIVLNEITKILTRDTKT